MKKEQREEIEGYLKTLDKILSDINPFGDPSDIKERLEYARGKIREFRAYLRLVKVIR